MDVGKIEELSKASPTFREIFYKDKGGIDEQCAHLIWLLYNARYEDKVLISDVKIIVKFLQAGFSERHITEGYQANQGIVARVRAIFDEVELERKK